MSLLSIITVCYNAEKTIQRTIDSVRKQKTIDVEYIIVDGSSIDSSYRLVRNSSDIVDISLSEEDDGLYDAMNKGVNMSSGKYLMFLNADDILKENAIEYILKEIKLNNSDIIYGAIELLNSEKGSLNKYLDINYNKFKSFLFLTPPHPGYIMKSSIFKIIGGFDTTFTIASDFDLQLKAWRYAKSYKRIDKTLVQMTLGGFSNSSINNRFLGISQMMSSYSNNISPIFVPLIFIRYLYKIVFLIFKK